MRWLQCTMCSMLAKRGKAKRTLSGYERREEVLPSYCRSGSVRDALGYSVFGRGWLQQERYHVQCVVVSVLPTSEVYSCTQSY